MRNLKRALSLTLASVMLLGMMVVGSSAAAGYSDVDADDNVEAIEVLQAVEVMVGDDRGFGPDRPVTRNEMAVVMGKLLNLNYNYYVSTCPFTDVAEWARGWVGACQANGIVSGRGDGIYDGEATVTAVEAASMMMRALGYFKYTEDYADGFQLVTVRQGNQIGIFNDVGTDATTPMTRNQVAQMALNALRSEIVDFTGTPGLEVNGVKVGYKAEYTARTSTEAKYNAIEGRTSDVATELNHKGQYYVQLGEELYDGKLRLNNAAVDDFGRPSRYWEYDGKAIGTYMKKELLRQAWTVEVTGKDFYDLLGADTIKKYSFDITIDGVAVDGKTGTTVNNDVLSKNAESYFDETVMAKTYKTGVGKTGKGVLTQVFVNPNTEEVDIAVINTYLAKAASDYNEKRDELKLNVYGVDFTGSNENTVWFKEPEKCSKKDQDSKTFTVTSEDFDVAGMKKDDIFLITQANGEVKTMDEPKVIAATTLNAFSKDNYVVNDGTQYDYNTTIEYDPDTLDDYTGINGSQQLKDTTYNLYLDAYGYLIGVEIVEDAKNYIFLTGIDQGTSNLNNKVSDAAGILLDGTFVNFRMNMTDSKTAGQVTNANPTASKNFKGHALWNTWCTYTVDKDGTYTLTEVKYNPTFGTDKVKAGQWSDQTACKVKIDTKRVALKASGSTFAYGNDDSIYIVPETKTVAARDEIAKDFQHPSDSVTPGKTAGKVDIGDPVIIISGVESRGTGIDTVSLETWNETDIKANTDNSGSAETWPGNVYTLYDDDNYIIGAVVVGEDTGASKNWVYVNSDGTKREDYDATEDEHTWVREVIKDGVSTDLIERGSGLSELESMLENTWYEVTYKADGSVKSVDLAYFSEGDGKYIGGIVDPAGNDHKLTLGYTGNFANANFTANVNDIESMNVNGKSTYLYEEVWGLGTDDGDVSTGSSTTTYNKTTNKSAMGLNNQPSMTTAGTLYVDTIAKKGVYVDKNVKSVLIQTNDGKESISWGDDRDDLVLMLDDLNYDNGTYLFKISAVVKEGRATVIIIHDWNETDARGNDKNRPGNNGGEDVKGVKLEGTRIVVTRNDTNDGDGPEVRSDIMNYLEANGYNLVSINTNTTGRTGVGYAGAANWQVIATKGGTTYTFNSDLIVMVPVYLDSTTTKTEVPLGTVLNVTAPATGNLVGATAADVAVGVAAATKNNAAEHDDTGYHADAYTVAWGNKDKYIRTNVFAVDVDGTTGSAVNYFKADDEATVTNEAKGANWAKYTGADGKTYYAQLTGAGKDKVTIDSKMAGASAALTGGYYKVSMASKDDQYIATGESTTGLNLNTGMYAKTTDGKYVAITTNEIAFASLSDDVTIQEGGYWKISLAATNPLALTSDATAPDIEALSNTNSSIELDGKDSNGDVYVKSDATKVVVKIKVTTNADVAADSLKYKVENGGQSTEIAVTPGSATGATHAAANSAAVEFTVDVNLATIASANKDTTLKVTLSK